MASNELLSGTCSTVSVQAAAVAARPPARTQPALAGHTPGTPRTRRGTFRVTLDITTGGAPDLAAGYDAAAVTRFFERLPFGRFGVEYPDAAISTDGGFAAAADTAGQVSWAEQQNRLQLVEMVARYYWGNEL